MESVIKLLMVLVKEKFWGEIIIKFQNGKPVIVNKNEQIKVTEE